MMSFDALPSRRSFGASKRKKKMEKRIALSVVEAETLWRSRIATEIALTEIVKETEVRELIAMQAIMLGHLAVQNRMHTKPIDVRQSQIARRTIAEPFLPKVC